MIPESRIWRTISAGARQAAAWPFRVAGRKHAFIPGTAALYELEDVRGYEALTLQRYFDTYGAWCVHQPVWFNRVDDLSRPMLDLLNVRFAVASDKLDPPEWWREVVMHTGTSPP